MMSAATIHKAGMLTGRQLVLVIVIGLHALVIGALMTMRIATDRLPMTTIFRPVTPVQPVEPPPPPPPLPVEPDIVAPRVSLPSLPEPIIGEPQVMLPPVETGPITVADPRPATVGETTVVEVPATALQFRAIRSPDDYYPATSLRLQEQGEAIVRVCVSPAGQLEGAPSIERSSGSRYLDAAAVKRASEAVVFTPATRNGAAVSACKGFRVNFRLR